MILTGGSAEAISFTDETSLPCVGAKVSIHAKVIRKQPLNWYYTLLQRAPNHTGELKSKRIVEVFFGLPEYERRKVLVTLKSVRIHITDPRPYERDVDAALTDMVPGGDVPRFVRHPKDARREAEDERRRLIALRMLQDGPPQRIRLKRLFWDPDAEVRMLVRRLDPAIDEELTPYFEEEPPWEFDFRPFERSRKSIVNVISGFLSKSGSVFSEAVGRADEIIEHSAQSPRLGAFHLCEILSAPHVFDKGDDQELRWIDGERRDVMMLIDRCGIFPFQPHRLAEVDSNDSFLVQAADFAAGIARETWHRASLRHLVGMFDYVTYNGRRICESEAAAISTEPAKRAGSKGNSERVRTGPS
jgi:hypothetical protein